MVYTLNAKELCGKIAKLGIDLSSMTNTFSTTNVFNLKF